MTSTPPVSPFEGRTFFVLSDFTKEEQLYLYRQAQELKELVISKGSLRSCSSDKPTNQLSTRLDKFQLTDEEKCVYLIFMENSTRTKESFRNAAAFHGMKVNVFDCSTSSFAKGETLTDTIKMLVGYSVGQTMFVIRSKMEGVCRWLELEIGGK